MAKPPYSSQAEQTSTPLDNASPLPWWVTAIVVIGALLMILGAMLAVVRPAMLVGAGQPINDATRVFAGYLFSRNLAIAVLLLATLGVRARQALSYLMVLTAAVQLLDGVVDCFEGRWIVAPGVFLLGALFLIAASRASRQPLWNLGAWR